MVTHRQEAREKAFLEEEIDRAAQEAEERREEAVSDEMMLLGVFCSHHAGGGSAAGDAGAYGGAFSYERGTPVTPKLNTLRNM